MADYRHCFGCRKSVYVDNVRKEHIPFGGKVCLYCFDKHQYIRKGALSNLLCFEHEDKNNPSTLMEKDVTIDRKKFRQLGAKFREITKTPR